MISLLINNNNKKRIINEVRWGTQMSKWKRSEEKRFCSWNWTGRVWAGKEVEPTWPSLSSVRGAHHPRLFSITARQVWDAANCSLLPTILGVIQPSTCHGSNFTVRLRKTPDQERWPNAPITFCQVALLRKQTLLNMQSDSIFYFQIHLINYCSDLFFYNYFILCDKNGVKNYIFVFLVIFGIEFWTLNLFHILN